jgi:hypothetical protein
MDILIENKANGIPFATTYSDRLRGIVEFNGGKMDKRERANLALPYFREGFVHFPTDKAIQELYRNLDTSTFYGNAVRNNKIDTVVTQMIDFTGEDGRPDDIVDAGTQFFIKYGELLNFVSHVRNKVINLENRYYDNKVYNKVIGNHKNNIRKVLGRYR